METPTFEEFPKMARLSREVIITEKIDGTNAQIYISEDGQIIAGSRSRWLTLGRGDNYGFAGWVRDNESELIKLGPGRHFGEWWGNGCQRGYGLPKGEKRFSLFNAIRFCPHGSEPMVLPTNDPRIFKTQNVAPKCCHIVPILWRGIFSTEAADIALSELQMSGSHASPGFMSPEGIVVLHIAGNVGFKKTIEKDSSPKSAQ